MTVMIKKVSKLMLSAIVFSWVAFSCTDETNNGKTPDNISGGEKEIIFSINVPAITDATSRLRSIDLTQENTIKTIDLVAFHKDNTGSYFNYYYPGTLNADNTAGASTQNCTVKVRMASYEQELVVITNAGTRVSDLVNSVSGQTVSKEDFLARLEYSLSKAGNIWNAVSASNFDALPMWGETSATVTNNTTQLSASLLRMLAKIDVQLDPTNLTALTSVFKLKSINLYNTLTNGRIVPNSANVQGDSVTAPTLPATPGKYLGPLLYNAPSDFSAPGATDVAMKGAIYLFETKAPADTSALNALDATCVVVGGWYGTDTQQSYYRVDFLKNGKFQDILRNHRYLVNIVSVTGRGYPTPDEAYRNKSVNMTVNVLVWNDNDMTDVTFDGTWYLSVSSNDISLSRTAETDSTSLSVLTDYNPVGSATTGWYVKSITDSATKVNPAPWLTVTPMQGPPNTLKYVKIQTLSDNTTGKDRVATIIFAAGRLEYPVIIRQTTIDRPTITFNYWMPGAANPVGAVIPGELDFSFSDPNSAALPQGFRVTVTPSTINFIAYRTDVPGVVYDAFDFAPPVTGVMSTDVNGYFYTVASPPKVTATDILTGSYLREEQLVFVATNGPYTVTKTLLLKHVYVP